MIEEIAAPYRKKRDSDKSKSSKKADHKHIWEDCFLHATLPDNHFGWVIDPERKRELCDVLSPGRRCVFCDRIKMGNQTLKHYTQEGQYIRLRTKKEMIDLHPEWQIIEVPGEDWYKIS